MKKTKMKDNSSEPIYLEGVSNLFKLPEEDDVIKKLTEDEKKARVDKEAKEVINLMTSNKENIKFKTALNKTIEDIKSGNTNKKNKENIE